MPVSAVGHTQQVLNALLHMETLLLKNKCLRLEEGEQLS